MDETTLDNEIKRIFTGWMFAASPGLNAVEHPVYDVWLNDCRQESDVPPPGERAGKEAREAKANESTARPGAGTAEAPVGVLMVGGIPVPRDKPPVPPGGAIEEDVPPVDDTAPATDGTGGEVLD